MPAIPVHSGPALPVGTLTFLLTDIEASTRLWERHPDEMARAHALHGEIIAQCVAKHSGHLVRGRGEGDSTFSVYSRPREALTAAADIQSRLAAEPWPEPVTIRVRAALHTGTASLQDNSYNSSDVNRCARIRDLASGGQTLLSQTSYNLVCEAPPQNLQFRDLGTHRLKDLSRPEHLYQLLLDGLPAEFPPLCSLDARLTNLPSQMTSFVGRDAEMAEVQRLLASHRLLTLTGPGGSGKTRLALQAAAEVMDQYPDGCWLVELSGLSDPALLPQAVAQVLGIREAPGEALPETLAHHLASRTALLLLDSCEHLLSACRDLAGRLLQACPKLRLLATSQQGFSMVGTGRYPVPALSLPSAKPPFALDQLRDFEAIRLFCERAAAANPSFVLSDANAPAVSSICLKLAGMPLALELAAAWSDVLTPEKIAARLSDRFRLLTRGNQAALPRHRTLRETIDWSYGLLSEPEKALFARLSVFAGGWTLDAVEAVCAGEGLEERAVLPLLSRLVDKSLVAAELSGPDMRYFLLDTLRHYSRERFDAAENHEAVCARHRQFFLRFGADAEAQLDGPDEAAWLDLLEREQENIRAVLDWSLEHDGEMCLQLVSHVYWLWYLRGYGREWRGWLEAALARTNGVRAAVRAKVLTAAGTLAWSQGDLAAAQSFYAQVKELHRQNGNRAGYAGALSNLGMVACDQGEFDTGRLLYEESLLIYRELQKDEKIARLLSNLGGLAVARGELEAASHLLTESFALFQEMKSVEGLAAVVNNLGEIARKQGDFSQARRFYQQDMALQLELGDKQGLAGALKHLGFVACAQQQHENAVIYLSASDALLSSSEVTLSSSFLEERDAAKNSLQAALSPEEYTLAWASGQTRALEDIVQMALQERDTDNRRHET